MGFSSVLAALFFVACIEEISASVVLKTPVEGAQILDVQRKNTIEKYNLRISERGVNFDAKVEIDENSDIEYFQVPPHHELSETNAMYDFRMNITVRRVKKDGVCHISPLPPNLPRPNDLAAGLKMLSHSAPVQKIEKIKQQWTLGDVVDRQTLRTEVQEFCGNFPIYRLEPYTPDSVTVVAGTRAERKRRDWKFVPCDKNTLPKPTDCNPNNWDYDCLISDSNCLYYISCYLDKIGKKLACSTIQHLYTAMVCCQPRCP